MTPKERAAMQQALEALIEAKVVAERYQNAEKREQAITALREALAEQEDEIYWIETNKALAKEIIELKRQAEQEPVGYFAYDEEHDIWEELTGPNAPGATKLYAAPVRTKDLTDDEIDAFIDRAWDKQMSMPEIIRAVIAADREKNE